MVRMIAACLRCGSKDLRMPTMREGEIAGMTEHRTQVCRRCGHRGPEMLFETEDARLAFEAAQRKPSG